MGLYDESLKATMALEDENRMLKIALAAACRLHGPITIPDSLLLSPIKIEIIGSYDAMANTTRIDAVMEVDNAKDTVAESTRNIFEEADSDDR